MTLNTKYLAVAITATLALTACGKTAKTTETKSQPATIQRVEGSDFARVVLTQRAVERLGIETTQVRDATLTGSPAVKKTVPYAAVLYGTNGDTWTYTNPAALTYVRVPIVVERIQGNTVLLSDGPASGTAVVTVGASELLGAEYGVDAS